MSNDIGYRAMSDDFIESIITLESENGDAESMYREFNGLESVAKFTEEKNERESENNGGDE